MNKQNFSYSAGFNNIHSWEVTEGVLPKRGNNPQKLFLEVPGFKKAKFNVNSEDHTSEEKMERIPLRTEQLSGTAFTVPRTNNLHTWLYKIYPSVSNFTEYIPFHWIKKLKDANFDFDSSSDGYKSLIDFIRDSGVFDQCCNRPLTKQDRMLLDLASKTSPFLQTFHSKNRSSFGLISLAPASLTKDFVLNPNPLRWKKLIPDPEYIKGQHYNFLEGLRPFAISESKKVQIYSYFLNFDMNELRFLNSDGDFLIVPQSGSLMIGTELGNLSVKSGEVVVIPAGITYCVNALRNEDNEIDIHSGYVLELISEHFSLPELGVLGSNGLANPRDFVFPATEIKGKDNVRDYISRTQTPTEIINKFGGELFYRRCTFDPLYSVVGWAGNYAPYKYDLSNFNCINSVNFDHPDPSIYTVLTCPSSTCGRALVDFVIFPPRWMCGEDTFRPPWYHRNCMTEFMGLITGKYDAKTGFVPGGASLHGQHTPHGPDEETFQRASLEDTKTPTKFSGGLAFMFETCERLYVFNEFLSDTRLRDTEYTKCWSLSNESTSTD